MALNQTMEILVPRSEDEIPVSTPAGGTSNTDFEQLYTLLANRVSALETALADMQKLEPEPEPEPTVQAPEEIAVPGETTAPEETPEETTDNTDVKEND